MAPVRPQSSVGQCPFQRFHYSLKHPSIEQYLIHYHYSECKKYKEIYPNIDLLVEVIIIPC